MAKRGRPSWVPSPTDVQKVKTAALAGLTVERTARFLRISKPTYLKARKVFSELFNAWEDTETEIDIVAATELEKLLTEKNPGVRLSAIRHWQEKRGSDVWRRSNRLEGALPEGDPIFKWNEPTVHKAKKQKPHARA